MFARRYSCSQINLANNLEASFCFVLLLIQSRNILIHLLNLCSFVEIHSFVSLFNLHTFIHSFIHFSILV